MSVKSVLFQHLIDLVFHKCLDDHFKILQLDEESKTDVELREVLFHTLQDTSRHKLERESHEFREK